MKKNKLVLLFLLIISFLSFNLSVLADDCSNKSCYCNSSGQCKLYRNPSSSYNVKSDMTKCGCKPTGQNTVSNADSTTIKDIDICTNAGVIKSAQIVGYGLVVIKIVAPILLLIMGSIELGKAIASSDEKAINSAVSTLVKRALAAVIIFFIPTIVLFVFNVVSSATEAKQKYECLTKCLFKPSSCVIPSNKLFN